MRFLKGMRLARCALQEAGIPVKMAPTIGIAVDHRRRNKSLESLQVRRWRCSQRWTLGGWVGRFRGAADVHLGVDRGLYTGQRS